MYFGAVVPNESSSAYPDLSLRISRAGRNDLLLPFRRPLFILLQVLIPSCVLFLQDCSYWILSSFIFQVPLQVQVKMLLLCPSSSNGLAALLNF
ncbi:hypothetical protein NPIL_76201 [Nephila pilipes]|uniref:Uncharacterized protein n=1 Tax=Nephila pilipes TaxID=299642 RepID=A0A8X6N2T5_NEPPI|nr:hypothetical protein NPIL_76201 [Nephila pilipes]